MSVPVPNANAPETPRKRGGRDSIDDVVQELRDTGLNIAPRNITYSPTQHSDSPGDQLYNNIKFLFWKDSNALHAVISECKSDFAGPLCDPPLSAERRTDYVSEKVADAVWIVRNSYHQSPDRLRAPSFVRTPPRSRHRLRSMQNIDEPWNEHLPNTPASPLAKKSMANTEPNTPTTTRDSSRSRGGSSFSNNTTAATSFVSSTGGNNGGELFGSSWGASQDPPTVLRPARVNAHCPQSITPALDTRPKQAPNKRKRTDETEDSSETPTKEAKKQAQEPHPPSPVRAAEVHWQIKKLEHDGLGDDGVSDPDRYWSDVVADERYTTWICVMSGAITFNNTNKGSLVHTKMNPVEWNTASTRVQRRFGNDRFLVLTAPSFTGKLPHHIGGTSRDEHRREAFSDWLVAPKKFLGRIWYIFDVSDVELTRKQKLKRKKAKNEKKIEDNVPVKQFLLFATRGSGIAEEVSFFEFLDWMYPFKENAYQTLCKSFARFQLSIKQSTPTHDFKPSQIRWPGDILANGELEDAMFEDPAFHGKSQKKWDRNEVMSDGCATMSVGAALLILKSLGTCDRPSAFQGRINGAKGMWTISDCYETSNPDHLGVWIEIRPSQMKIKPREEDMDDQRSEKDRWTFDVKGYSKPSKASHLHRDFLPVLEDRHDAKDVILEMIRERIDLQVTEQKEMMHDPAKLVLWRHKYFPHQSQSLDGPGLPQESSQKASLLVEGAGYMPKKNSVVAEAFKFMIGDHLQRGRRDLKFPCSKSADFYGVIDPKGVLKPGEVHLVLSQPLEDEATKERFSAFAGKSVLVTRDPTLRGSDIQKVRCICHPELAHLKDIVVFSTRGKIPLAAKLQGGDYDGDKFWVCADERLVAPFLNAPVLEQKGIDFFGIEQEKRTLGDVVSPEHFGTDEHAKAFMRIVLPIACRQNPLGYVTKYCQNLSYARHLGKGLWDDDVTMIIDLHDHIIDAAKQGYMFGNAEFHKLCKAHGLPHFGQPSYRTNIEYGELHDKPLLEVLGEKPKHKLTQIQDCVLFEVVNPAFVSE